GVHAMSKVKVASPDAATSRAETVSALVNGRMRFHEVPPEIPPSDATAVRREAVAKITGATLDAIAHFSFDSGLAANRHCENLIGYAQITMGIVGPMTVHGDYIDGDVLIPMATTEGALLASINRGCAAIRLAGGATVHVEDVGMTRAPVFRARSQREARAFLSWIAEHEPEIRQVAEGTSRFLKMTGLRPYVFGTTIFLRFRFTTGDAMGMNMATI